MSLKGLIFDLEGVIVFTDQYHYKAWKQMADEKGIYFDQEIKGHPLSDEEKQKMAEEKNDIRMEQILKNPNQIRKFS